MGPGIFKCCDKQLYLFRADAAGRRLRLNLCKGVVRHGEELEPFQMAPSKPPGDHGQHLESTPKLLPKIA